MLSLQKLNVSRFFLFSFFLLNTLLTFICYSNTSQISINEFKYKVEKNYAQRVYLIDAFDKIISTMQRGRPFDQKMIFRINLLLHKNNEEFNEIADAFRDLIQTQNSFALEIEKEFSNLNIVSFIDLLNLHKDLLPDSLKIKLEELSKDEISRMESKKKKIILENNFFLSFEQKYFDEFFESYTNERNGSEKEWPKKVIALTFDDGPDITRTVEIVNILKSYKIFATFFMLSSKLAENLEASIFVKENGHQIASHSINHPLLTKLKKEDIEKEIWESVNELERVLSLKNPIEIFRSPYGGRNLTVIKTLNEREDRKLTHVMWNIDSLDWKDKDPVSIQNRVFRLTSSFNKGIILFHDIHDQTVKALPEVLEQLIEEGFKFVTFDELINLIGLSTKKPQNYKEIYDEEPNLNIKPKMWIKCKTAKTKTSINFRMSPEILDTNIIYTFNPQYKILVCGTDDFGKWLYIKAIINQKEYEGWISGKKDSKDEYSYIILI